MGVLRKPDSEQCHSKPPSRPSWGYYVLVGYPIVYILGLATAITVLLTGSNQSLFTSGLTGGFIIIGLSVLALTVYPAYRVEAGHHRESGNSSPPVRRFAEIGLGVPVTLGIALEVISIGLSGDLNVPGFMAGFAALVIHPFVVAVMSIVYLLQRRRRTG